MVKFDRKKIEMILKTLNVVKYEIRIFGKYFTCYP